MTDTERDKLYLLTKITKERLSYEADKMPLNNGNSVILFRKTIDSVIDTLNSVMNALSDDMIKKDKPFATLYMCKCDESVPCYGKGECQANGGKCWITTNINYALKGKELPCQTKM